MKAIKVTVVTVVHGLRWKYLRQVLDACVGESRYSTFIIVDNGCADAEALDAYAAPYGERFVVLRQERNIGYSGAISKGLLRARDTDSDFVFVLDDDSVPEVGAVDYFISNLALFVGRKVVLVGNRVDVPGNKDIFTSRPLQDALPRGTIFEVFSFRKIINAVQLMRGIPRRTDFPFVPIVPTEAFVTGGTFLPMEVVRTVDVPDASMFIYGEDLEYAWRVRKAGYQSYACARPIIRDIDLTFSQYGDHIFGLFDPKVPAFKVYYRMRNAVRISLKHSDQSYPVLALNVFFWYIGLLLVGLYKNGLNKNFLERACLVAVALYTGFVPTTPVPKEVVTPK